MDDQLRRQERTGRDDKEQQAPVKAILPDPAVHDESADALPSHNEGDNKRQPREQTHNTRWLEAGCALALVAITGCYTYYARQQVIATQTAINARELEAEAVAFVVGAAVGLKTSDSSCDYIHLYRGDREALAQSLTRVLQTASAILRAIEGDPSMVTPT